MTSPGIGARMSSPRGLPPRRRRQRVGHREDHAPRRRRRPSPLRPADRDPEAPRRAVDRDRQLARRRQPSTSTAPPVDRGTAPARAPRSARRAPRRASSRSVRASGAQSAKPVSGPPRVEQPRRRQRRHRQHLRRRRAAARSAPPGAARSARCRPARRRSPPAAPAAPGTRGWSSQPATRVASSACAEPRQRDRPRRPVRDQLGDHRVVEGRDRVALLDPGLDAHARPGSAKCVSGPVAGRKPFAGSSA